MSDSLGTHEHEIPGEWAALVVITVLGAAFGFLVLWFTMLRHERTALHRARRRSALGPGLIGDAETVGLFAGAGAAAVPDGDPTDAADPVGRTDAAGLEDSDGEPVPAEVGAEHPEGELGPAESEAVDPASA